MIYHFTADSFLGPLLKEYKFPSLFLTPWTDTESSNKSADIVEKDPIHIAAKKSHSRTKTVKEDSTNISASEKELFLKLSEKLKRNISKNSKTKKCPYCNLSFTKRANLTRQVFQKYRPCIEV